MPFHRDLPTGRRMFGELGMPLHVRQYIYDIFGGDIALSERDLTDDELVRLRDVMQTAEESKRYMQNVGTIVFKHPVTGEMVYAEPGSAMHKVYLDSKLNAADNLMWLESTPNNEFHRTFGRAAISHTPTHHTIRDYYDWDTGLGSGSLLEAVADVFGGNFMAAAEWLGNQVGTQPGDAPLIEITVPRTGDVREGAR